MSMNNTPPGRHRRARIQRCRALLVTPSGPTTIDIHADRRGLPVLLTATSALTGWDLAGVAFWVDRDAEVDTAPLNRPATNLLDAFLRSVKAGRYLPGRDTWERRHAAELLDGDPRDRRVYGACVVDGLIPEADRDYTDPRPMFRPLSREFWTWYTRDGDPRVTDLGRELALLIRESGHRLDRVIGVRIVAD